MSRHASLSLLLNLAVLCLADVLSPGSVHVVPVSEGSPSTVVVTNNNSAGFFHLLVSPCASGLTINVTSPMGVEVGFLTSEHDHDHEHIETESTTFVSEGAPSQIDLHSLFALTGNYSIVLSSSVNTSVRIVFATNEAEWPLPGAPHDARVTVTERTAASMRVSWEASDDAVSYSVLVSPVVEEAKRRSRTAKRMGRRTRNIMTKRSVRLQAHEDEPVVFESVLGSVCSAQEAANIGTARVLNTSTTQLVVDGLEAALEYEVTVLAINAAGNAQVYLPVLVHETEGKPTRASNAWLYGMLSVIIVCLMALVGGVFICLPTHIRDPLLLDMLGLSAGALIGDTFLHLLPEATEQFGTLTAEHGAVVLGGLFFAYLTEQFLHTHSHMSDGSHGHSHGHQSQDQRLELVKTSSTTSTAIPSAGQESQQADSLGAEEMRARISLAWNSIAGELIHNFVDGMLIGAAYISSSRSGLTTTIAVVLHEIPQEIGDLAVYVRAGMSVKKALFMNLMSALTAILGAILFLGLSDSSDINRADRWMLLVAAGIFPYLALAQIIPEIYRAHTVEKHSLARKMRVVFWITVGLSIMGGLTHMPHGSEDGHGHSH